MAIFKGSTRADTVDGGVTFDILYGNGGNDELTVRLSGGQVHGGKGDDTITGLGEHSLLWGDQGNDRLVLVGEGTQAWGGAGRDTFDQTAYGGTIAWGGGDRDTFLMKGDTAHGGGGADTFKVNGGGSQVFGDAGIDRYEVTGHDSRYYYGASITINDYQQGEDVVITYEGGGVARLSQFDSDHDGWLTAADAKAFHDGVGLTLLYNEGSFAGRGEGAITFIGIEAVNVAAASDFLV